MGGISRWLYTYQSHGVSSSIILVLLDWRAQGIEYMYFYGPYARNSQESVVLIQSLVSYLMVMNPVGDFLKNQSRMYYTQSYYPNIFTGTYLPQS